MKKKIAFIAYNDYANVLTEWSNAINNYSKSFESKSICFKPHSFNYDLKHDIDLEGCNNKDLNIAKKWIEESSYIIFSEELPPKRHSRTKSLFLNSGINIEKSLAFSNNRVATYYGGTTYRKNYKVLNERNKVFFKRLYAPDLYRLSEKSSDDLVIFPTRAPTKDKKILINEISAKYNKDPVKIIHSPSGTVRKGSAIIKKYVDAVLPIINNDPNYLNFEYVLASKMSNSDIIKLKEFSHIHIDQFNSAGGFGVSSIESMIFGNIILCTMNNTDDSISRSFGNGKNFPIIKLDSENEKSIEDALNLILKMNKAQLIEKSIDTINWYFDNASPEAAANAFEKKIFI